MSFMRHYRLVVFQLVFLLMSSCTPTQPARQISVITHPDGLLYVGDQVSFEVLAPVAVGDDPGSIQVMFDGQELGRAGFAPYGIGGRSQATLWWVWDTRSLKPGDYTLTFNHLPEDKTWTETYSLLPADQVPPPEPAAHWASAITVCCNLYYITGTAAERDISTLSQEADQQSASVSAQLGSVLGQRIDIILMSRVVGHGGFTSGGVYVSYLDANYIGNDMSILFHHEFTHYYDNALGGIYLPSMFQEGLAVYLSGGHFKPESLGSRAAALLDLGWYIPLATLANDFYNQQHDISYLEAGSLIQYLVVTYGWDAFNLFYRNIPAPGDQTISSVIGTALHNRFGFGLTDLESAYLAYLRLQTITEGVRTDLQLTVTFFDTVRRYQKALDPSAYFLIAWLPDGAVMRQRGIVADFLRRPLGWDNRLLESLLTRSQKELFSGDYEHTAITLKWANWVLNGFDP
jgi:hypothetical protein